MKLRSSSELELEQLLGNLLRGGVLLAAVVVFVSGVVFLARHGGSAPEYRVFRGEPADLRNVAGIVRDARAGQARAAIQFGLLLLMATPVARVAFSVFAFAVQRDRTYVVVTLIVLVVLTYSMSGGSL